MRCISVSIALLVLLAATPSAMAQIHPATVPLPNGWTNFGLGPGGFSVTPVHFLRARPYIFRTFIVRPMINHVQRIYALRAVHHRTWKH